MISDTRLKEVSERLSGYVGYDAAAAIEELLALRQLLRESKPALEAGARLCSSLPGCDSTMTPYTAHSVTLRALAHRAGELT